MTSRKSKLILFSILTITAVLLGTSIFTMMDNEPALAFLPELSQISSLGKDSYLTIEEQTVQPRDISTSFGNKYIDMFMKDPLANSIAVITLVFMITSAIGVFLVFTREGPFWIDHLPDWSIPILALIGIGISIYLSFIEVANAEPVCGPIGDCGAVQQSQFTYLFGVIPIGILGLFGYSSIIIFWLLSRFGPISIQKWASLIIWILAWFGLFFSIYLTFLEPFVIGATCAWCITSAVVMTLLLWASTPKAKSLWSFDEAADETEELV
jgi:uncharacterized membrane protein